MNDRTVCTKHDSSSLANNKISGCDVPRVYTKLPVSIHPSAGNSTHVDRSTALCTYSKHTTACSLQINDAKQQRLKQINNYEFSSLSIFVLLAHFPFEYLQSNKHCSTHLVDHSILIMLAFHCVKHFPVSY